MWSRNIQTLFVCIQIYRLFADFPVSYETFITLAELDEQFIDSHQVTPNPAPNHKSGHGVEGFLMWGALAKSIVDARFGGFSVSRSAVSEWW